MELKPGYKRTDAGIIPSDWDAVPLGKIGDALIGLTYRPEDVRPHGTLVLRASNIQNDKLAFDDNVYVGVDVPEQLMVRPGDVLICVRNGSRNLIGKAALLDDRCVGMQECTSAYLYSPATWSNARDWSKCFGPVSRSGPPSTLR